MKQLKIIFKGNNWELGLFESEESFISKVINNSVSYSPTTDSLVESKFEINIERLESDLDNYIVSYVDTPDTFYVTIMKPKWED